MQVDRSPDKMTKDTKPKVEGNKESNKRNFHCKSNRNAGPDMKEVYTKVAGLKSHTFNVGNAKYATKYQKTWKMIANHVQCDYKGGSIIAKGIRNMILPVIAVPRYLSSVVGATEFKARAKFIWQQEAHQEAMKRVVHADENKKQEYALVFGQCSPELVSKIQGLGAYVQADVDQDVVQLLTLIRGYCCSFDDHQQSTFALEGAKHHVLTYYQGYNMSTMEYIEHFKALVGVVETYRGAYGKEPGLITAQLIA